jgi:hypothetical protein
MNEQSVTRYVVTYVNRDGMRTLAFAAQGRDTFETEAAATTYMHAVTAGNSADAIKQAWGENPRFEVRPCQCWPGHFDPQSIWFEE